MWHLFGDRPHNSHFNNTYIGYLLSIFKLNTFILSVSNHINQCSNHNIHYCCFLHKRSVFACSNRIWTNFIRECRINWITQFIMEWKTYNQSTNALDSFYSIVSPVQVSNSNCKAIIVVPKNLVYSPILSHFADTKLNDGVLYKWQLANITAFVVK